MNEKKKEALGCILNLLGWVVLSIYSISITFMYVAEDKKNNNLEQYTTGVIVTEDDYEAYVFNAEFPNGLILAEYYSFAIANAITVGDEVILILDDGAGQEQWVIVGVIGETT